MAIYDVIWKIPAYVGTQRSGSDQTPRFPHGVWSESSIFVTYDHLQKTHFSRFLHNLKKISVNTN